MNSQIELWHLVTLLLAFLGFVFAAGKVLLGLVQRHIDMRFDSQSKRLSDIEATGKEEAGQWQRVERELLSLKADLPLAYVRRDDYIRGQSVLETKLDALATKIENAQLRGLLNTKGDGL